MVGRFFKCAPVLSLLFLLFSCADSDNPVGPSPVVLNTGGSKAELSAAGGATLEIEEEFNCTHLEEWFVRFSDPGSVEANVATLYYNYTGAPAGTKTLEIFWDYENEPTKAEYIQLGYGDVQRENDGRSNYIGIVQHIYSNINEPTHKVVRVHFIADGKTGNCASVRRITVKPGQGVPAATPLCGTLTFSSALPIVIPAAGFSGPANPYPSSIVVSGVTGTVTDVDVSVFNLTHGNSFDVDLLLDGPGGQNTILMNFAGGGPVSVDLTFDDAAPLLIGNGGVVSSGTWSPFAYFLFAPLPGPAPNAPFPYGFSLAAFNGTDPNGTWSLWANDAFAFGFGDTGIVNGGWSLTITTTCP
jgi:hypothetical protein